MGNKEWRFGWGDLTVRAASQWSSREEQASPCQQSNEESTVIKGFEREWPRIIYRCDDKFIVRSKR